MNPLIIPDIVTRHAEEAAFLWHLRGHLAAAPHIGLRELTVHDHRIEAHLDGLRVAGDAGWGVCLEALGEAGAGEVFAAAVLALERGHAAEVDEVIKVVAARPHFGRALASA